ncbi:hypothetical protein HDU85_002125 [Gaertneriomyces sp. JEL0708]|nr:hypothetical protein BC832DRAFT_553248 [Gaertneriomyces semiglobifer]KAJ3183696.1 hypothetical protein HDU85_002125 [Gaertneriomyces sp. JEL0708]
MSEQQPTAVITTNPVFRDMIHAETVKKEMRRHHVYEHYMLTPNVRKGLVVAEKPNKISVQEIEKSAFDPIPIEDQVPARTPPLLPLTSNQIYGFFPPPPPAQILDRRFHHPKAETEITKVYGVAMSAGKKDKEAIKK